MPLDYHFGSLLLPPSSTTVKKLLANLFGHQGGRPGASSNDRASTSGQVAAGVTGTQQDPTPASGPAAASGQQEGHAAPAPVGGASELPAVAQTGLSAISGPWNTNPFSVDGMVAVITGGGTGK